MLLSLLLLLLACAKAYMVHGPADVKLKDDGDLYLLLIKSPLDYNEVLQGKKVEKIQISHTTFTQEVAQDLAEKFCGWKDLNEIAFLCCYYKENSANILAKGLANNSQINSIELLHEHGYFIYEFIEELAKVPPFLKKMKILTSKNYTEYKFSLKKASLYNKGFSTLETLELSLYPEKDYQIFLYILPFMKNLKNLHLKCETLTCMNLLKLLQNPKNIELLELSICNDSFDFFVEILPKLESLRELHIRVDLEDSKMTTLIERIRKMKIQKLVFLWKC